MLTQDRVLTNATTWAVEAVFFAGIVFPIVYGLLLRYRWWETVMGRMFFSFGPCISGALLRTVLAIWGVPIVRIEPGGGAITPWGYFFSWLSLICIIGIGLILIISTWEAIRHAVAIDDDKHHSSWAMRILWLRKDTDTPRK